MILQVCRGQFQVWRVNNMLTLGRMRQIGQRLWFQEQCQIRVRYMQKGKGQHQVRRSRLELELGSYGQLVGAHWFRQGTICFCRSSQVHQVSRLVNQVFQGQMMDRQVFQANRSQLQGLVGHQKGVLSFRVCISRARISNLGLVSIVRVLGFEVGMEIFLGWNRAYPW